MINDTRKAKQMQFDLIEAHKEKQDSLHHHLQSMPKENNSILLPSHHHLNAQYMF